MYNSLIDRRSNEEKSYLKVEITLCLEPIYILVTILHQNNK